MKTKMVKKESSSAKLVKKLTLLRQLMDQADYMAALMKPVTDQVAKLREQLLNEFTEAEMKTTTAAGLRVSRSKTPCPNVKDVKKFFKFACQPKNWDLLQKSVSTPAWRERMEQKRVVPGVEVFNRVSLSVTRVKGKP